MLEAQESQKNTEKETKEGWSSSRMVSPACSVALSPRPGADKQSSTQCAVSVQEVGNISHVHKSGFTPVLSAVLSLLDHLRLMLLPGVNRATVTQ